MLCLICRTDIPTKVDLFEPCDACKKRMGSSIACYRVSDNLIDSSTGAITIQEEDLYFVVIPIEEFTRIFGEEQLPENNAALVDAEAFDVVFKDVLSLIKQSNKPGGEYHEKGYED